jgi:hypothetical protein
LSAIGLKQDRSQRRFAKQSPYSFVAASCRGGPMIYKTPSPQPNCVRVIFELPACLWADHVAVVGDFNGWRPEATPMRQGRDGIWRATVDLPTGRDVEFRYLVDGAWMTDYHADGFATNHYGSDNSLVIALLPQESLLVKRNCSQVQNGAGQALHRPRTLAQRTPRGR